MDSCSFDHEATLPADRPTMLYPADMNHSTHRHTAHRNAQRTHTATHGARPLRKHTKTHAHAHTHAVTHGARCNALTHTRSVTHTHTNKHTHTHTTVCHTHTTLTHTHFKNSSGDGHFRLLLQRHTASDAPRCSHAAAAAARLQGALASSDLRGPRKRATLPFCGSSSSTRRWRR